MASSHWAFFIGLVLCLCVSAPVRSEEGAGVQPLLPTLETALAKLPEGTRHLFNRTEIEAYLSTLEEAPPDWRAVYGGGPQDPEYDERLFALNRERDGKRSGKDALEWRLAFLWEGELSTFDADEQGFRIALGPKPINTGWGFVRFKYEDLPGQLVARAGPDTERLKKRIRQGETIEVDVLLMGRLIPEESVIYDFSHDEEGKGLIMPVVLIESVGYALKALDGRQH